LSSLYEQINIPPAFAIETVVVSCRVGRMDSGHEPVVRLLLQSHLVYCRLLCRLLFRRNILFPCIRRPPSDSFPEPLLSIVARLQQGPLLEIKFGGEWIVQCAAYALLICVKCALKDGGTRSKNGCTVENDRGVKNRFLDTGRAGRRRRLSGGSGEIAGDDVTDAPTWWESRHGIVQKF
jgi:hypothetical protein